MVAAVALADLGFRVAWHVSWHEEGPLAPPLSPEAALARSAARGEKQDDAAVHGILSCCDHEY